MTKQNSSRADYQVCYQCRIRKIRCDRERPQCSNCIRFGFDCEWSGSGKKKNQTAQMVRTINELRNRVDQLVDTVSRTESSLELLMSQLPATMQAGHYAQQMPPTPPNGPAVAGEDICLAIDQDYILALQNCSESAICGPASNIAMKRTASDHTIYHANVPTQQLIFGDANCTSPGLVPMFSQYTSHTQYGESTTSSMQPKNGWAHSTAGRGVG